MPRFRSLATVLLCLPLFACFEDPVREHLHVTLRGAGPVIVTVVQQVGDPDLAKNNAELADRLEESRSAIESNLDPWSNRFAQLQPLAEHQSVEHVDGLLRRSIHSAVLSSFDDVVRMVEADGLTGNLAVAGGIAELSLFPTGGSRATYTQRQEVERQMTEWSEALATYFAAAIEFYSHLDGRPDRAVPCFAQIFDTHEGVPGSGPLEPEEEDLIKRVKDSVDDVVLALLVDDDSSFSFNELTRLVYDPFPARLTMAVEGQILQSEGWISESRFFERPAVDAWNALKSLEGRWLSPDIVTALASPVSEDQQPDTDPVVFASLPRYSGGAPTSGEIESALLSALVPDDVLTLRWRPARPLEEEAFEDLLSLMAEAEASAPH